MNLFSEVERKTIVWQLIVVSVAALFVLGARVDDNVPLGELGCVDHTKPISFFSGRAYAALFQPSYDREGLPVPFERGLYLPACQKDDADDDDGGNPPTVDLKVSDSQTGPFLDNITVPNNTPIWAQWTTSPPPANPNKCDASGNLPAWAGPKNPSGSTEGLGPVTGGPITYNLYIVCENDDGDDFDRADVEVLAGPPPTVKLYANEQDDRASIPSGTAANLHWESENATSCNSVEGPWIPDPPSPKDLDKAYPGEPSQILTGPRTERFVIRCDNPSGPDEDDVIVDVTSPITLIKGDIYARGQIRNVHVTGPSVVSAGAGPPEIEACDPPNRVWCVSGYAPKLRETWRTIMDENLNRLQRERAVNSGWQSDLDGPDNRLGGGVWYNDGPLTIPGGSVDGPGTFIVNGDITVTGDISADEPIGIVSRNGNITIEGNVANIKNVYFYAQDESIIFKDNPRLLSAQGSFVAQKSFLFPPRPITIIYDARVALKPPPGFISFILPTVIEQAP